MKKMTSIDEALIDMLGTINLLRSISHDFRCSTIPTMYMQREHVENWQKQLDILKSMDDSNPQKAIYNHEGIYKIATMLGLKY